jgi:hypothetical protein
MHIPDHTPPVTTTASHVRWAAKVFVPDLDYSDGEVDDLVAKYPTTRALRTHFMANPDFIAKNRDLVRQVLSASLVARKRRAELMETELAELSRQVKVLMARMSELNCELVGYLELIATAKEISADLREIVRREKTLTTQFAQQGAMLRDLGEVVDLFGGVVRDPMEASR